MIKRVFISKDKNETEQLGIFLAAFEIELISASCIRFEPLGFEAPHDYDVIFFSSPRAADFFLNRITLSGDKLLAAVGATTADFLRRKGFTVSFVGEGSNPETVGRKFAAWCGTRRVLIPHSDRSLHSIANLLDQNQITEIEVYRTVLDAPKIEDCDLYVFTSPSNVEAFLCQNQLPEQAKLIAWGTSTLKAIQSAGYEAELLPNSSLEALMQFLQNNIKV